MCRPFVCLLYAKMRRGIMWPKHTHAINPEYITVLKANDLQEIHVTGFEKRDLITHFEKIELLLP